MSIFRAPKEREYPWTETGYRPVADPPAPTVNRKKVAALREEKKRLVHPVTGKELPADKLLPDS